MIVRLAALLGVAAALSAGSGLAGGGVAQEKAKPSAPAATAAASTAKALAPARGTRAARPVSRVPSATAPAAPETQTQYVLNPGFEEGLAGWTGWQSSLSLKTSNAAVGRNAARVTRSSGSAYSIVPTRRPVTAARARETYTANAWVRSDSAGRRACLRVREWVARTEIVVASAQSCVTATAAWQRFPSVSLRATRNWSEIDVYVYYEAPGKTSFEVDEVTLHDSGPPPDRTPPEVALTAPAEGAVVSGTVDLAAEATDARGVVRVEFRADDTVVGTATEEPWTVRWETASLPDGPVTLRASAYDAAGNRGNSAPRHVRVDNRVPETTIDAGPSGTVRSEQSTFRFSADEPGVSFECSLDGAPFAACRSPHVAFVAAGSHGLRVRATDPAGKQDETPAERSWWADPLLQNGTFEAATRGWTRLSRAAYVVPAWHGYQSTLSLVGGGIAGPTAARVTGPGEATCSPDAAVRLADPTKAQCDYSIYSAPKPVDATVGGREYVARGFVRSETPGREVCLAVREFDLSRTIVGRAQACVVATGEWQAFPAVRYTPEVSGHELEVLAFQWEEGYPGTSFDVDGLSLSDGTADPTLPEAGPHPVLLATADVAACWSSGDEAVARILDTQPGIVAIAGDVAYDDGTADEFAACYDAGWGRFKDRTRPAVGDHEYRDPGAAGYFAYFGGAAGEPGKGWYSYDLGDWHVVVLNSNCLIVACGPGSEQYEWLRRDLATNGKDCTAAYFHHPRWSSGYLHKSQVRSAPFWELLYRYGADVTFAGNDHNYQRFAPLDPSGNPDPVRGIRQFVVGMGGAVHYRIDEFLAGTEAANTDAYGVLKLTLRPGAYDWEFLPQEGRTFTDTGSSPCSVDRTPPQVTLVTPPDGSSVSGLVRLTATASDDVAVERVDFVVDGAVVGSDETAPYSFRWDASGASGSVTVQARAVDTSRNVGSSSAHTVAIAEAPVETTITDGPEGTHASTSGTFSFASSEPGSAFECSLDGGAFEECASPVTFRGLENGEHVLRVQAVAPSGAMDPTPAERAWIADAPNLQQNGGFEEPNAQGNHLWNWRPHPERATLRLLDSGYAGSHSTEVAWTGVGSDFSIFPSPRPVLVTEAGRVYLATAWVRSITAGRPVLICLQVREWNAASPTRTEECMAPSADWTRFPTVRYTAIGGHQLDVLVYLRAPSGQRLTAGDSFVVDEITLR